MPQNRRILEGVVAGIGGYGNSIGIPTVGGEVAFDESYSGNPLVNVFCLGIARHEDIIKGTASGVGNPVFYVGAKTGRDGIHGATMASAEFDEKSEEKRPAVQVGDPFTEKLLLEACLEVMKTGALVGIQDMGAAGLTCSTSRDGQPRRRRHRDRRPARAAARDRHDALRDHALRIAGAHADGRQARPRARGRGRSSRSGTCTPCKIGAVTDGQPACACSERGTWSRDIPNRALTDEAPVYHRPDQRGPDWLDEVQRLDLARAEAIGTTPPTTLLTLLASPTIASKRWIYRQYDHMVRTNTIVAARPGRAASCA